MGSEKASHKSGVSQVLLIITPLIQRPNSGHLAVWSIDYTRRKGRLGLLCVLSHVA